MGTGEVARYVGTYGSSRVRSVAYLGGILPYLIKTEDNPTGLPAETFTPLVEAATKDRFGFLTGFLQNFYNADQLVPGLISDEVIRNSWNVGVLPRLSEVPLGGTAVGTGLNAPPGFTAAVHLLRGNLQAILKRPK